MVPPLHFLMLRDVRMRMKADILVVGSHEPQAAISCLSLWGGQVLCDLVSESGMQVLRKGNLDLTEQNISNCAVHSHCRSSISSSMAMPNCVVKAVCCTTQAVYIIFLTENK